MRGFDDFVQYLHEHILLFVNLLFASIISYLIDFKMLFLTLGWAMFFDLITGVLAFKKTNKVKWFDASNGYLIKSKLLRLSFEKMGAYLIIILCMAVFESHIFKVQIDYIDALVGKPFYGTAIVTTICVLIEYWSVLENLKKLGIDVIAKIQQIITFAIKLKDKIQK